MAIVVLSVVALSGCGGSSSSGSNDNPTVPVPATPTPAPEPTPEPGLSKTCATFPPGDVTADCPKQVPNYFDEVEGSIKRLVVERPDLFDENGVTQSVGAYYVELIKMLDEQGLCAYFDGIELGVAATPEFNDQYDILTAKNQVRTGSRIYRTTCYPSAVPPAEAPLQPSPAGCSLPPSRDVACSREAEGRFFFQVEAAVKQVMEDRPELFDFTDTATRTDWPRILDLEAYQDAVAAVLAGQGFCAKNDRNEEIAIKDTNDRSEQYDVQLAHTWVRLGGGMYRSSCYPAAF